MAMYALAVKPLMGNCGAVTIASCVFPGGGCCCAKVFSELRGALIGVVVEVVGGPDWVAAGAVLTARTESIDSEASLVRGRCLRCRHL